MLSLYLLFAVLVLCSAEPLTPKKFRPLRADQDTPLSFQSTDDRFAARVSLVGAFSFGFWSGAWFHSLQLELTNDTAVGDYIWGALYVGTGFYPVNYLSYFSADVETHRDPPADPSKYDWGNFSVDTSSGFVASTFLHLVEKDPEGHVVEDRALSTLLWTYDAASSAAQTNSSAGIWVAVFQGKTLLPTALRVTLTYVMTNSAGVLNTNTKPLITPKAIESWIQIQDWPFDSTNNTLSLLMAVGSGSATFSASGSVASGSGSEQVYFRAADSVYIDGEVKNILQINASASANGIIGFQNDGVVAQLEARYKASASVTLVEIKFPYGKFIEYDPTVGSGPDPYQSGANVGLIVGVTIGVALFLVAVVIIVYFVFGKRADYKSVA